MRSNINIETVDTHTAGEPTRIVTGGLPLGVQHGAVGPAKDRFRHEFDHLRKLLLREPRGHADMFGAVIIDSVPTDARFGVFFMDNGGYLDMCGHGLIGTVTYLIESGRLTVTDGEAVDVATPAGTVTCWPSLDADGVSSVTIENVSSFVVDQVTVEVDELGPVTADIAHSGNTFALVSADAVGIPIAPDTVGSLIEAGLDIRRAINDAKHFTHPESGDELPVELVEFYDERDPVDVNVTIFGRGQVDRSPCGTGTCAKLAYLYDQGSIQIGERYRYESVIGTQFVGEIVGTEQRSETTFVEPRVTGSAYRISESTHLLDPADPLDAGFDVSVGDESDR